MAAASPKPFTIRLTVEHDIDDQADVIVREIVSRCRRPRVEKSADPKCLIRPSICGREKRSRIAIIDRRDYRPIVLKNTGSTGTGVAESPPDHPRKRKPKGPSHRRSFKTPQRLCAFTVIHLNRPATGDPAMGAWPPVRKEQCATTIASQQTCARTLPEGTIWQREC